MCKHLTLLVALAAALTAIGQRPVHIGLSGSLGSLYGGRGHGSTGAWVRVAPGPYASASAHLEYRFHDPYAIRLEGGVWIGFAGSRYHMADGSQPFQGSTMPLSAKTIGARLVRYRPLDDRGKWFIAPNVGFGFNRGSRGWSREMQGGNELAYWNTLTDKQCNLMLLGGFEIVRQTKRGNQFYAGLDIRLGITPLAKGNFSVWTGPDAALVSSNPWGTLPDPPPPFESIDYALRGTSVSLKIGYRFKVRR